MTFRDEQPRPGLNGFLQRRRCLLPLILLLFVALPSPVSPLPNIALPVWPSSPFWDERQELENGWTLQENRVTGHWRLLDPASIRRAWGSRDHCERMFEEIRNEEATPEWNLPFPTLKGPYFWMDRRVREGWRLQEHPITRHWRLLDPWGIRRGWGRREAMLQAWTERVEPRLGEPPDRYVVMVHGIIRTGNSWILMRPMLRRAAKKHGERLETIAINYPSSFFTIDQDAEGLASVIEGLEPDVPIVLLCHSMGGLIANAYLARREHPDGEVPHPIEQCIYLGTPFKGAIRADQLRGFWLYRLLFGPAGQQLSREMDYHGPISRPTVPTVAIAGSKPPDGYARTIPGDDDGTVEVESALPDWATHRHKVRCHHTFLMYVPSVFRIVRKHLFEEHPATPSTEDTNERQSQP